MIKKKILFIGHDASLTGAPVLLLNLLRLLSDSTHYSLSIILGRPGPLLIEYEKILPVLVLKNPDYGKERNFIRKALNYFSFFIQLKKLRKISNEADVIFSNTVANGRVLRSLGKKKNVICYVHELESVISSFCRLGDAPLTFQLASMFLVPANAVKRNLIDRHAIPNSAIQTLNYYLPFKENEFKKNDARDKFCNHYGIDTAKFLIAGMGTATQRKGFDIFIEIAEKVSVESDRIKFIWVGDFVEESMKNIYENSNKNVVITGYRKHDLENLLPFDCFLLSSREDPYPLAVLEAAYLGIPSICFKEAGGITDFVDEQTGWPIPDLSAEKVVRLIVELERDRNAVQNKGFHAHDRVLKKHADGDAILDKFDKIIQMVTDGH